MKNWKTKTVLSTIFNDFSMFFSYDIYSLHQWFVIQFRTFNLYLFFPKLVYFIFSSNYWVRYLLLVQINIKNHLRYVFKRFDYLGKWPISFSNINFYVMKKSKIHFYKKQRIKINKILCDIKFWTCYLILCHCDYFSFYLKFQFKKIQRTESMDAD